jgi:hypothetical protein
MKPVLLAPGTKRLKLNHDEPLSSFAFNINLRHYSTGGGGEEEEEEVEEQEEEDGPVFGPMMPDGYQSEDGDGGEYARADDAPLRVPLPAEDDTPVPTSLQAFEPPTDDDEPESDDNGLEFTGEVPGRVVIQNMRSTEVVFLLHRASGCLL